MRPVAEADIRARTERDNPWWNHLNSPGQRPAWIGEVKWSDRVARNFAEETWPMQNLARRHDSIHSMVPTTRTYEAEAELEGRPLKIVPSSLYCYTVGRNVTSRLQDAVPDQLEAT